MDLIYVYCITRVTPIAGQIAEAAELIYFSIDSFTVIGKYVSSDEFSVENFKNNSADSNWKDSNILKHMNLINSIMEYTEVLPFRFGTVFNTQNNLERFIRANSGLLSENFKMFEGLRELSVKIYFNRRKLGENLDRFCEKAATLEKIIMGSSPGRAYLLNRKKEDLIDTEIDRFCRNFGHKCMAEFENLSESKKMNNLLTKEINNRNNRMIMSASFLVRRTKVSEFLTVADMNSAEAMKSAVFFEISGPWPPFSFISQKFIASKY
jgi:hypothetical protein